MGTDSKENQAATDTAWDGNDGTWPAERAIVAYEEIRTVLDAQRDDITEIDEKALRTVRTTVVLLGVTATAVRAVGLDPFGVRTTTLGVALLVFSLVAGVVAYSQSSEIVGPNGQYLERLASGSFERPWHEDFLHQLTNYIEQNRRTVEINGWYLLVAQSTLVGGVSAISLSVLPLRETVSIVVALAVSGVVTLVILS